MAFNLTYRTLNDQNIRHIYSDQKLRFVFRKSYAFRPLKEELPIPPLRLYPKRFYDYYPSYNIGIPRAPAFRGADQDHVERIVRRICKPIQCQKERRKDLPLEEDEKDGEKKEDDNNEEIEGKEGGKEENIDEEEERKMKSKQMKLLIERLQKPTQSSEKKKYHHEDRKMKGEESSIPKLPPIPSRF